MNLHDSLYFDVLKCSALEHPDPWINFLSIRSLSKHSDRLLIEIFIKCIAKFHTEIGDIYFPLEALGYLEQFKPLSFDQYEEIRCLLVQMFQTKSAYTHFSYYGSRMPFDCFLDFTPEPENSILWPEFLRDLAGGDPKLFTRVLTTMFPDGQLLYNAPKYIHHVLHLEQEESARVMRVWIVSELILHKKYLSDEKINPITNTKNSAVIAYKKLLTFSNNFTDEQTNTAHEDLAQIDNVNDYFDVYPFHNL